MMAGQSSSSSAVYGYIRMSKRFQREYPVIAIIRLTTLYIALIARAKGL